MSQFKFQADSIDSGENVGNDKQNLSETICEEIVMPDIFQEYAFKSVYIEGIEFFLRDLDSQRVMISCQNYDVIPATYEGGLKVWECTYDLLSFLKNNDVDFENKIVLDLGCGCGLLGIYAGRRGAKTVHFQDYNVDVLSGFTIPNVRRNKFKSDTKFYCGDWGSFINLSSVKSVQYDYILTSETLYNASNYPKLYELFSKKLKSDGEIYVASKSYYFGVGGTVQQFQEGLKNYEILRWETAWKNNTGLQREILQLTKTS